MAKVNVLRILPTAMWVVAEVISERQDEGPIGQPICTRVLAANEVPEESVNEFLAQIRLESN